jgi:hypothetical protein
MKKRLQKLFICLSLFSATGFSAQSLWTAEICIVTVDSATMSYISVIWNKPAVTDIDSFYIYRENTSGVFVKIGAVAYADSSVYDDIAVDVNAQAYAYKISALDTLGTEGLQSPEARTAFLTVTPNGSYNTCAWANYQNTVNPPANLNCIWDSTGSGSFVQIGSTFPSSWTSWNHNNFSAADSSHYCLLSHMSNSCSPSRAVVNTSRSNIKNLVNPSAYINTAEEAEKLVRAFPNPAGGTLNLEWNGSMQVSTIEITGLRGELVYSFSPVKGLFKQSLDISSYAKGIYFVRFYTAKGALAKRIVKA